MDAEIVFIKRTMMERGDKPGSVMLHPDTVVVLKDRGYVDEEITPAGRRTATAGGLPICATTVIEPGQISISVAKPDVPALVVFRLQGRPGREGPACGPWRGRLWGMPDGINQGANGQLPDRPMSKGLQDPCIP